MKKITFLLSLMLLMCFSSHSQVQVGFGTNVVQNIPFATTYQYSYTQSIYLSSEINAPSGYITSIQWYFNGIDAMSNNQDLVIYLGSTSKSVFASTTDWEPLTNLTKVYEGGIVTDSTKGWKTITLTTPFYYDSSKNLIVSADENTPLADVSTDKFYCSSITGKRTLAHYSNTVNADPLTPPTATSTPSYVPDIIFGGISEVCPTPINLSISNLSGNSATVNWSVNSTTLTVGCDYYLSNTNVSPNVNTVPTGSGGLGNSVNLTGLATSMTYYVWVRNKCDVNVNSNWSLGTSFTTVCNTVTSINETFDGVVVPQLPSCWTKIVRGPSIVTNGTVLETTAINPVFSNPNSVKMFNSSATTDVNDIILITPSISNINSGLYRLKFYAKQLNSNGFIQIGTLNSNSSTAVFTPLPNYDNVSITSTTTEYTVYVKGYTGTDTYVGIRMSTPSTYATVLLDDIRWEQSPLCDDVSGIIVPDVTGETAKVNWTGSLQDQTFELVVGPVSTTDPNTLVPLGSTLNEKTITGLTGKTTYKVWVRSVCVVGGNGNWIGPVLFTTDCPSLTDINENFDGYTVLNQQLCCNQLPDCWSSIIRSSVDTINPTYVFVHTSSHIFGNIASLPNSIEMSSSGNSTSTTDVILVTPPLSTLVQGTYRLRFIAQQNAMISPASVTVGTLNNANLLAVFTPYQKVSITTTPQEYIVSFNGYFTTDRFIGIKLTSENTGGIFVHLDNIVWEFEPTCTDVTHIVVPSTTPIGGNVSWTANGSEIAWQVVVGEQSVTDPKTLTPINANDTNIDLTGLNSNTSYKVWVRSHCSDSYGAWIGPVVFKTTCPAVSSLNETFDNSSDIPACWAKIFRGPTSSAFSEIKIITNPSYSYLGQSVGLNKAEYNVGNDVILVTPNLSNIFSGKYRLKFYAMRNPNGNLGKIQVGTLDGNTLYANFSPIIEFSMTNGMVEYTVNFDSTIGTDTYIGFRISSSDAVTLYIDNVRWEPMPICADPTNFIINSNTNSATFSWSPNDAVASWDVVTDLPIVSDPNTVNFFNTAVSSITINGLSTQTSYKVWIRSVCSNGQKGDWIGPYTYTTDCVPLADLNEDVELATVPLLPSCWTKILRGTTLDPNAKIASVSSDSHSGINSIIMRNNQSKPDDDIILVSPRLSSLTEGSHTLKFWAKSASSIQVGTMDSNTNTANMNILQIFPATANYVYTEYIVPFDVYAGSDPYIGIRLSAQKTSEILYVDDITFDRTLSNQQFVKKGVMIYPNPVNDILNISSVETISSILVYNMLGQRVNFNANIDGNNAKIDMSNLSSGSYMVKILANSSWETFKALKH